MTFWSELAYQYEQKYQYEKEQEKITNKMSEIKPTEASDLLADAIEATEENTTIRELNKQIRNIKDRMNGKFFLEQEEHKE